MFTFGYGSRKAALIKALVVLVVGIAGLASRSWFGVILGAILAAVGVRDLLHLLNTREKDADAPQRPRNDAPQADDRGDGLQITDLSSAKEVEYKKEEGNYTKE